MKLFDMTDADIQRAEDAYCNRLYEMHYGTDQPEPCCKICHYYYNNCCMLYDYIDMECDEGDEYPEKDEDDWCDRFKRRED